MNYEASTTALRERRGSSRNALAINLGFFSWREKDEVKHLENVSWDMFFTAKMIFRRLYRCVVNKIFNLLK